VVGVEFEFHNRFSFRDALTLLRYSAPLSRDAALRACLQFCDFFQARCVATAHAIGFRTSLGAALAKSAHAKASSFVHRFASFITIHSVLA
jgi:hypothetical protein